MKSKSGGGNVCAHTTPQPELTKMNVNRITHELTPSAEADKLNMARMSVEITVNRPSSVGILHLRKARASRRVDHGGTKEGRYSVRLKLRRPLASNGAICQ